MRAQQPFAPTSPDAYWNRGATMAPWITGAAEVMDGQDLIDACAGVGVSLPISNVLDVGCGTGRFAQHCSGVYLGVDLARDQVAYALAHGVNASVIAGPEDLPRADRIHEFNQAPPFFDWIVCFSVFTHIGRGARAAYLRAFAELSHRSTTLIVDVIPGDGRGDVPLWTAEWGGFLKDLEAEGWRVAGGPYDRTSPDNVTHRYIRAERI